MTNDETVVAVIPALQGRIRKLKAELDEKQAPYNAAGICLAIEAMERMLTFASPGQYCEARRWDAIMRYVIVLENRMRRGTNAIELEVGIQNLILTGAIP